MRAAKPKILQVINSLAVAGAESLVAEMTPRLRDLGFDVSVAVLSDGNTHLETTVRASGVPVMCARAAHRSSGRRVISL